MTVIGTIAPTTAAVSASFTITAFDPKVQGAGGAGDMPGKVELLPVGNDPHGSIDWPYKATVWSWRPKVVTAIIPDVGPGPYYVKLVTACGDTESQIPANSEILGYEINVVM